MEVLLIQIAIVGKTNVGKSSLFNRLVGSRQAIVSNESGTTRDLRQATILLNNTQATLVDSGGLGDKGELFARVTKRSLDLAKKSQIVLFVVSAKSMPTQEDIKLFWQISHLARFSALIVNKVDNKNQKDLLYEFAGFGTDDIIATSCEHALGIDELKQWLDIRLRYINDTKEDDFFPEQPQKKLDEIRIAIVGRPNVGKSSLANKLLKDDRSIVSAIAGTTIDPVDANMQYKDRNFCFIDTAGLRRRSKILGLERLALDRTKKVLKRADIALLVLDASEGITTSDEKLVGLIEEFSLGLIIVVNKIDKKIKSLKELSDELKHRFSFLRHIPFVNVSATSAKSSDKILDLAIEVFDAYNYRIPTSKLNEIIKDAMQRHNTPTYKTKPVKIFYATQFQARPPKIALVCNYPKGLHFSFLRYLKNSIRKHFAFMGSPIILEVKDKNSSDGLVK